jgi:spermidine synthase
MTEKSNETVECEHLPGIKLVIVKRWPSEPIIELYKQASWWKESQAARDSIAKIISGSFLFVIAIDGKKTVGMGRVISDGVSDAYLQDVTVLRDYRGQKIGGEIIRTLSAEAIKRGIVWLGLIGEPGTAKFYERLGYKILPGFMPMRFPTAENP